MKASTTKALFQKDDKVSIHRLEKGGYTDEGTVLTASPEKLQIKITKSKANIVGNVIIFGFREGTWRFVNGNNYSRRDHGFSIVKM